MKALLTNFRYTSHGFKPSRLQALPLHFLLLPVSIAAVSSLARLYVVLQYVKSSILKITRFESMNWQNSHLFLLLLENG